MTPDCDSCHLPIHTQEEAQVFYKGQFFHFECYRKYYT